LWEWEDWFVLFKIIRHTVTGFARSYAHTPPLYSTQHNATNLVKSWGWLISHDDGVEVDVSQHSKRQWPTCITPKQQRYAESDQIEKSVSSRKLNPYVFTWIRMLSLWGSAPSENTSMKKFWRAIPKKIMATVTVVGAGLLSFPQVHATDGKRKFTVQRWWRGEWVTCHLILLSSENDVGSNAKQCRQRRYLGLRSVRRQTTQMQHTTWLGRVLGQPHLRPINQPPVTTLKTSGIRSA